MKTRNSHNAIITNGLDFDLWWMTFNDLNIESKKPTYSLSIKLKADNQY